VGAVSVIELEVAIEQFDARIAKIDALIASVNTYKDVL
jgi:hypothetical protein